MFAFSQIEPETTGQVADLPIDKLDYLSTGIKTAFGGTLGRIYDYRQNLEEQADLDSPVISAEEANRNYPINDGWKEPVHESYANYRNTREQKQQAQAFYLESQQNLIVKGAGLGTTMLSGMLNPVDLALMFVPFVGEAAVVGPIEEQLMYRGALGRGAQIREALTNGAVTRNRLEQIFGKMAGVAESSIQGAGYGLMVEPINRTISNSFGEDPGHPLLNIGEMALTAGGMHALMGAMGKLWSKLSDDTKLSMMTKGIDDFVKGKDIDVETVVKIDPKFAEEQVRLKEELTALAEKIAEGQENPMHVQIAKDLGLRYDGVQALIPGQYKAVYTSMDAKNPYTVYVALDATRADVKARMKEKIAANKPEPTFEQKIKDIFQSRLEEFRKEMVKPGEEPKIPETGGETEQFMYSSVLDEIRKKNLRTNAQIQQNFPAAQLSREQAAVLRRQAWKEEEVKTQHQKNLEEVINKANQYNKDNPPGKGVRATNKNKAIEDMPTPPNLKVEEMQHNVLKPDDSTIAIIEQQTKLVLDKLAKDIESKFITPNSWEKFHPDVQQAIVETIANLIKDYPILTQKDWKLDLEHMAGSKSTWTAYVNNNKLAFGAHFFIAKHYEKLLEMLDYNANKPIGEKWLAGYGIHSIMYHELAHLIANLAYKNPYVFGFGKVGIENLKFTDAKIQAAYEYVVKHPPTKKQLSGYSQALNTDLYGDLHKYAEPFAEAFTQAYSGIGIPNEWQKGFNNAIGMKTLTLDEELAKIGLERQHGKLGKIGYFTTQDKNFTGLSVQITKDHINLNNIQVPEELRGKGIGTKKITQLQILAKSMDLPLTLTAEALAKDVPGNQARLETYYQKLGFERVKDNDFVYNKQSPKKIESKKAAKDKVDADIIEMLKKQGEKALEDLKKKADEFNPITDVIKSATDCLSGVL